MRKLREEVERAAVSDKFQSSEAGVAGTGGVLSAVAGGLEIGRSRGIAS